MNVLDWLPMREQYDFTNAVTGKYAGLVSTHDTPTARERWRNPSVRLLAAQGDPREVVVEAARALVLRAADAGVLTTPVDPFRLAELCGIRVTPSAGLPDAQLVREAGADVIRYNPDRPRNRVRFSICHELGHSLFPDWPEQVRNRLFHSRASPADYELEALCNLAAAEMLLPLGGIQKEAAESRLSIESALQLARKYEASAEAVLLRLAGLAGAPCAAFAAAPEGTAAGAVMYRLEYVKGSPGWRPGVDRGDLLPADTVARECSVIGFTSSGEERWASGAAAFAVEAVGVSPYPNRSAEMVLPRVAGLLRPPGPGRREGSAISYVRGDALEPHGAGPRIIAHVVSDAAARWGKGFGLAVQRRWPGVQQHFQEDFIGMRGRKLGRVVVSSADKDIYLVEMISQRGYGPSPGTRLRYGALRECLVQLRGVALGRRASVHMPRIGTGEAGGSWALVENLLSEELCSHGVTVTVYDLPGARRQPRGQGGLFDPAPL